MTEKSLSREPVKFHGAEPAMMFTETNINAVKNGVIDNQEQITELRDIAVDQQEQINYLKSLVDKLVITFRMDITPHARSNPEGKCYSDCMGHHDCKKIYNGGTVNNKFRDIVVELDKMKLQKITKIETDLKEEEARVIREAAELVAKEKKDLEEKAKKKSRAEARSKVLEIVAEKKAKLKELEDEILLVNFASESEDSEDSDVSEDPEDPEEELDRKESELRAQLAEARSRKEKSRGKSKKTRPSCDPSTWSKEKAEKISEMWCE